MEKTLFLLEFAANYTVLSCRADFIHPNSPPFIFVSKYLNEKKVDISKLIMLTLPEKLAA